MTRTLFLIGEVLATVLGIVGLVTGVFNVPDALAILVFVGACWLINELFLIGE